MKSRLNISEPDIEIKTQDENLKDRYVLEMKHIEKSFGENYVLQDVNIVLNKRENLVILGQSGSGKSVLIKCIVGLMEYDKGNLLILGRDVGDLTAKELLDLRKKSVSFFKAVHCTIL